MISGMNLYCSTCRQTRRFSDRDTYFECENCKKRMIKVHPPEGRRDRFFP